MNDSEWKKFVVEIGEQCCVKWIIKRANRHKPVNDGVEKKRVLFSQTYACNKAVTYEPEVAPTEREVQKKSIKKECDATLTITCLAKEESIYIFEFEGSNVNHVPGDLKSDLGTLPFPSRHMDELIARVQSNPGVPARSPRLELLRTWESQDHLIRGRSFNYHDVYNKMQVVRFL